MANGKYLLIFLGVFTHFAQVIYFPALTSTISYGKTSFAPKTRVNVVSLSNFVIAVLKIKQLLVSVIINLIIILYSINDQTKKRVSHKKLKRKGVLYSFFFTKLSHV